MVLTDLWAQIAQTKVGDHLRADGGFTCLMEDQIVVVKTDAGGLFVNCLAGKHNLNGQLGEQGELIGFCKT